MMPFKPQLRLSLFKSIMVLFERAYPSFSVYVVGECCLQQSLTIVISAERKSFTARLIFDPLTSFCICCVIYTFFHVLSSYFSVSLTKTAPFSSIYFDQVFSFTVCSMKLKRCITCKAAIQQKTSPGKYPFTHTSGQ